MQERKRKGRIIRTVSLHTQNDLHFFRLDDQEILEQMIADDLERMGELGKTKDEALPEIEKDLKDAKAEKAKLQEMVFKEMGAMTRQ